MHNLMSITESLLREYVDVSCPACGYVIAVQLVDVRTQVYRRCRCCRELIHLIDQGGSTYGAMQNLENAAQELEKTLKGLFK
jgi:hypothetical protein